MRTGRSLPEKQPYTSQMISVIILHDWYSKKRAPCSSWDGWVVLGGHSVLWPWLASVCFYEWSHGVLYLTSCSIEEVFVWSWEVICIWNSSPPASLTPWPEANVLFLSRPGPAPVDHTQMCTRTHARACTHTHLQSHVRVQLQALVDHSTLLAGQTL